VFQTTESKRRQRISNCLPRRKKVDAQALFAELGPIIEGLKREGQKNMATFSPVTVLDLAHKLERIAAELSE